ncbi:MAG TPA: DMT family transporter, partial [Gaiellaceae bacterium]|nr:DMT family transporter [Gaiellaceae bacterium]
PVVPLAVDAARGTTPSAPQWLGIALVLVGIAALSREPSPSGGRQATTGAGLAVLAALGFGLFFVGIDAASDESATWAVLTARCAAVPLAAVAALATSAALRPPRAMWPVLVTVGLVDTFANVLVATATTRGAAGIVAVLSSLYPVVTIVLARIVLAETLSAQKRIGGVVALAGAAFVAAG